MLVLSVAALLTSACLGTGGAHAGTYLMRSCNVPGAPSAPAGPWTSIYTSPEIYGNDECGRGGGFGLNAGTITNGNSAAVLLGVSREAPHGPITIRQVRLWLIARLGSTGGSMFVSMSSGSNAHVMQQGLFGSPGGSTLAEPFVSPPMFADTHIVHVALTCAGGNGGPCVPASSNPLEIRGAEVTLHEAAAPAGTVEGGSLLDGQPQAGVRALRFSATDGESGVAEVAALLGNTVVATHDVRPECKHADLAACPTARSGSLIIDTRTVEDGTYPLALRVIDAAGNRQTIPSAATVTVANGADRGAQPSNGTSATRDARLTAAFVGRRGSRATLRYHQKATIRGRLTTASGAPIGQAKVEVVETPSGRPKQATTRAVTTSADGRFRYTLRSRGMSRNVSLRYRAAPGDHAVAASRILSVRVAASGSLRVSLRGVRVSYNGRILSRPIPRRGLRLYVEGRAAGGRWTRFAIRRTTSSGRFSGRYRLRVRRPGVRLQFRIRIPRQSGYPYATGVSRAVTRTVR